MTNCRLGRAGIEATAILQKYKAGKAALDKRIVDNELWFPGWTLEELPEPS